MRKARRFIPAGGLSYCTLQSVVPKALFPKRCSQSVTLNQRGRGPPKKEREMKSLKFLCVFLAMTALAAAQSAPSFGFFVGYGTALSQRPCADANVGSIYTDREPGGVVSVCRQTSPGVFSWVTSFVSSVSGGTLTIASGKSLTVNNTMTLAAGADGQTFTFPATSASIARTDAANTFTGVQTFSSAPVLSTSTVTSGSGTITFPTSSLTVSGATATWCGTTNTCSATSKSTTVKIVSGVTAALDGASPSQATVASLPAFTATGDYACSATVVGTAAQTHVLAINQQHLGYEFPDCWPKRGDRHG